MEIHHKRSVPKYQKLKTIVKGSVGQKLHLRNFDDELIQKHWLRVERDYSALEEAEVSGTNGKKRASVRTVFDLKCVFTFLHVSTSWADPGGRPLRRSTTLADGPPTCPTAANDTNWNGMEKSHITRSITNSGLHLKNIPVCPRLLFWTPRRRRPGLRRSTCGISWGICAKARGTCLKHFFRQERAKPRILWTEHPHCAFYRTYAHFHPCAYVTLWLKVSCDVSAWNIVIHMSSHVWALVVSFSRASTFSPLICLFSILNFNSIMSRKPSSKPQKRTRKMIQPSHRIWAQPARQLRLLRGFCSDLPGLIRRHRQCDAEFDDELIGKTSSSPLFIQEREEPANLRQTYHSHEECSLPAQSFLTRTSTERPVYEPSSDLSQKRKSSRGSENDRIRILLGRQKRAKYCWSQIWDPEARTSCRVW